MKGKRIVGVLLIVWIMFVIFMQNKKSQIEVVIETKATEHETEESERPEMEMSDENWFDRYETGFNLGQSLSNLSITMDTLDVEGNSVDGMPAKAQITKETIQSIAQVGFTFVRCIVDFGPNHCSKWDNNAYVDEFIRNGANDFSFTIDKRWFDKLREIIDWCGEYHLKFILCVSNTTLMKERYLYQLVENEIYERVTIFWAQPNEVFEAYARLYMQKVWTQIAHEFSDIAMNQLAYELVNEPLNRAFYLSGGFTGENVWDDWSGTESAYQILQEYEKIAIDAIRQIDKEKMIVVPTYAHNVKLESLIHAQEVAESDERAVIAIHWYYPQDICGNEVSQLSATFDKNDKVWKQNMNNIDLFLCMKENAQIICTEGAVENDEKFVPLDTQREWFRMIRSELIENRTIPFALFDNATLYDGVELQQTKEDRLHSNQSYGFLDRKNHSWYDWRGIYYLTGKEEIP